MSPATCKRSSTLLPPRCGAVPPFNPSPVAALPLSARPPSSSSSATSARAAGGLGPADPRGVPLARPPARRAGAPPAPRTLPGSRPQLQPPLALTTPLPPPVCPPVSARRRSRRTTSAASPSRRSPLWTTGHTPSRRAGPRTRGHWGNPPCAGKRKLPPAPPTPPAPPSRAGGGALRCGAPAERGAPDGRRPGRRVRAPAALPLRSHPPRLRLHLRCLCPTPPSPAHAFPPPRHPSDIARLVPTSLSWNSSGRLLAASFGRFDASGRAGPAPPAPFISFSLPGPPGARPRLQCWKERQSKGGEERGAPGRSLSPQVVRHARGAGRVVRRGRRRVRAGRRGRPGRGAAGAASARATPLPPSTRPVSVGRSRLLLSRYPEPGANPAAAARGAAVVRPPPARPRAVHRRPRRRRRALRLGPRQEAARPLPPSLPPLSSLAPSHPALIPPRSLPPVAQTRGADRRGQLPAVRRLPPERGLPPRRRHLLRRGHD